MRRTIARTLGLPLVLLGAWGAIVPFVGPSFGYPMPPGSHIPAWQWSTSHLELHLLPGIAAIVGGLLLLGGIGRGIAYLGALIAILAGSWFVLGPVFSPAILGSGGMGGGMMATPSTLMKVVTPLGYHYGTGLLIAVLAASALGLLAVGRRAPMAAFEPTADADAPLLRERKREPVGV